MHHTALKWTDDDMQQAIEHAHEAGVQEERRRVLRAAGDLFASKSFRGRALRSREAQIAAAVAEMERVVREHVPDARCARGCAVCVARMPVRQSAGWPRVAVPGGRRD